MTEMILGRGADETVRSHNGSSSSVAAVGQLSADGGMQSIMWYCMHLDWSALI